MTLQINKTIDIRCGLCGSNDRKLLYKKNNGYYITRCNKCSFIYAFHSSLAKISYKDIYSEKYFSSNEKQGFSCYVSHKDILKKNSNYRIALIEKYKKRGCILDIGCAKGFFLKVAQRRGWEVYGLEISAAAAKYCKTEFDIPVFITEDDYNNSLPKEFFDVITLYDAIEHVENPVKLLSGIYKSLKSDGVIVIETPDISSIYAKFLRGYSPYIRPPAHLSFFSKDTIKRILLDTGFKIEKLTISIKIVNISYLINVLETHNKITAKLLSAISFMAGNLKYTPIKLYLGGLHVVAKKCP